MVKSTDTWVAFKVWGVFPLTLLFALSQFLVAWGIAWFYARKASEFDAMAEAIARDANALGLQAR